MPTPLLDVIDLRTHFQTAQGVVKAVDGVSFNLEQGQTLALVGESGCGKSVTARSILQLIDNPGKIVGGNIFLHPEHDSKDAVIDIAALPARGRAIRQIRGNAIAMIFQEPMAALSPVHTIGDQITEAIRLHLPLGRRAARKRAIALLDNVGIPKARTRVDSYTFELSGGMRQRAMIAMALACQPRLLIADEPTTALDVTTQATILELLRDLQQEYTMAMLFITHDLGVVAHIADTVAVMYLGEVVEHNSVTGLFAAPQHPYTRALLRSVPTFANRGQPLDIITGSVPSPLHRPEGCAFAPRCDVALTCCSVQHPPSYPLEPTKLEPSKLEPTKEVRCWLYSPDYKAEKEAAFAQPEVKEATEKARGKSKGKENAEVLLELDNLTLHFPIKRGLFQRVQGYVKAVNGISLELYQGETLGLVGESGCGKTSLGQSIMRLHQPNSGAIRYHQQDGTTTDLANLNDHDLRPYRHDIRMIFQDPYGSLNPRMPVVDLVGEALNVAGLKKGKALRDYVAGLLEQVGLPPEHLHRYVHTFSGGQRQRIGVARAIATQPKLVVADEAVSALDVSVQAQILNLLQQLQAEYQLTYLFISHDLSVIAHISDRVAVMYVGHIVELADADALFAQPLHPYTEALLSAVLEPDPQQQRQRIRLQGEVADPANVPSGCPFHPRCQYAQARCQTEIPVLRAWQGRQVACHLAEELELVEVA